MTLDELALLLFGAGIGLLIASAGIILYHRRKR